MLADTAAPGATAAAGGGAATTPRKTDPTDLDAWKALLEDCKQDPNCMSITRGVEKKAVGGGASLAGTWRVGLRCDRIPLSLGVGPARALLVVALHSCWLARSCFPARTIPSRGADC